MAAGSPLNGTAIPAATTEPASSESGTIIAVVVVGTVGLCLLGGTFIYVWYMHQRKMREKLETAPESALETVLRTNAGLVQELQAAHSSRQADKIEACLEKHKTHVESHRNVQELLDQARTFLREIKLRHLMEQGNYLKELLKKANGELDCFTITEALKQYCNFWEENKLNIQEMAVEEGIKWQEGRYCFEEDAGLIKATKDLLNDLQSALNTQHSLMKSQLRELIMVDDTPVSEVETTLQRYNELISKHKETFTKDEGLLQLVTLWIEKHSERRFLQSHNEQMLCLQGGNLQAKPKANYQDRVRRDEDLVDGCESKIKNCSEIDIIDDETEQRHYPLSNSHTNDMEQVISREMNNARHYDEFDETKDTSDNRDERIELDKNKIQLPASREFPVTIAPGLQLSGGECALDENARPLSDLQLHKLVAQGKQFKMNLLRANNDLDELAITEALTDYLNFWQLNELSMHVEAKRCGTFGKEELKQDPELVKRSKRLLSTIKSRLTLEMNLQNLLDDDNTTIDNVRLALEKYQAFIAIHKDKFEEDTSLVEKTSQWLQRHTSSKPIDGNGKLSNQAEVSGGKTDASEASFHYSEDLHKTSGGIVGETGLHCFNKTTPSSSSDKTSEVRDYFTDTMVDSEKPPWRAVKVKGNTTVPNMRCISSKTDVTAASDSALPHHIKDIENSKVRPPRKQEESVSLGIAVDTESANDGAKVAHLIEQGKDLKVKLEKANTEHDEHVIGEALAQYLNFWKQNKMTLREVDASSSEFQKNDLKQDTGLVARSKKFLSEIKSKLSLELNLQDFIENNTAPVGEVKLKLEEYKAFIQKHKGKFKEDANLIEKVTFWIQNPMLSVSKGQANSYLQVGDQHTKKVRTKALSADSNVHQLLDQNKELKAKLEKANTEQDESAITIALTQYLNFRDKNKSVMQRAAPRQGMSWQDYKTELEEDFALVARSKRLLFKTLSQSTFDHEGLKTILEELTKDEDTSPTEVEVSLKRYLSFIANHPGKFKEDKLLIEKVRVWLQKHKSDTSGKDEKKSYPEDPPASVVKVKPESKPTNEEHGEVMAFKQCYEPSQFGVEEATVNGRNVESNKKEGHQGSDGDEEVGETVSQSDVYHEVLRTTIEELTSNYDTLPKEVEEALQRYKTFIETHRKKFKEDIRLVNMTRAWLEKHTPGTLVQEKRKQHPKDASASHKEEKVKSNQVKVDLAKVKETRECSVPPRVVGDVSKANDEMVKASRKEEQSKASRVKSRPGEGGAEELNMTEGFTTKNTTSSTVSEQREKRDLRKDEQDSKLSQLVREGKELTAQLEEANKTLSKPIITDTLASYIHFWETNTLEMQRAAAKNVSLWQNRQHELKEDFQLINCSKNILSKLSKIVEHEDLKGKLKDLVGSDATHIEDVTVALHNYELFLEKNLPEFKRDESLIRKVSDWINKHTSSSGEVNLEERISTHELKHISPRKDASTKASPYQLDFGLSEAAAFQKTSFKLSETVDNQLARSDTKEQEGTEFDSKELCTLQKDVAEETPEPLTEPEKRQEDNANITNEEIEVHGYKKVFRNRQTPEEKKFKVLRDCLVRAITVLCSTIDEVRKQLDRYTRFHEAHADVLHLDSILVSRAKDVILKKEAEINRIKAEGDHLNKLLVSGNEAGNESLIQERLQAYRDYCKAHPKICKLDSALVDDCLQTLRQKERERKDPVVALQTKLLNMSENDNADEIIGTLSAYTQCMAKRNLKIDDKLVKKAKEFISKAKKEEYVERLRQAIDTADVDKIKEALAEYVNFCNLSPYDADEHRSLVEKANAILNDPIQFNNCVKERELKLKEDLLSAHETSNERTIEDALKRYIDFVHRHRAGIGTGDTVLLQETDNVLAIARERNAMTRAIKKHDYRRLKIVLDRLLRMGGEKWVSVEMDNAKVALKSMERVENLKVKILQLDRSLMLEIRSYKCPPVCVHDVMKAVLLILGDTEDITSDWLVCRNRCCTIRVGDYPGLLMRIKFFGVRFLHPEIAARALEILLRYTEEEVNRLSLGAAMFHAWALGICDQCLRMVDQIPTAAVDDRQLFILTIVAREFKVEMEALQKEREEELKAEVVAKWQKRKEGFEKKAVKKWMKRDMNANYSCSESSDDSGGEERSVFILGTRETLNTVFERFIPDDQLLG